MYYLDKCLFVSLYHGIFHWHNLWITSITEADYITISEDVYFALDPYFKKNLSEITPPVD